MIDQSFISLSRSYERVSGAHDVHGKGLVP